MLTSHKKVARVSFTGGPTSARHVIQNTANNFAEVSLELGGKSPFIVFDDADIESAVNGSVGGIFAATWQSCVAGSRLLLHEDIADDFIERLVAVAKSVKIGDPMLDETEMGPLCTQAQQDHIKREVAHAVSEGATIRAGGNVPEGLDGIYFEPTIVTAKAMICALSIRSCLALWSVWCGFRARKKRFGWPMIRNTGWRRGFSRGIQRVPCACLRL